MDKTQRLNLLFFTSSRSILLLHSKAQYPSPSLESAVSFSFTRKRCFITLRRVSLLQNTDMSDDSSCDSGDPEYYIWRHGISMPEDEDIDEEMFGYLFTDSPRSTKLLAIIDPIRRKNAEMKSKLLVLYTRELELNADKAALTYEVDQLKGEKEKKDSDIAILTEEVTQLKRELGKEKSEKIYAFMAGMIIEILLYAYVIHH